MKYWPGASAYIGITDMERRTNGEERVTVFIYPITNFL
jgi:hypothetical protein